MLTNSQWVLQELFFAKEVRFCCGNIYETGQAFYGFILLIQVLEVFRVEFSSSKFSKEHMLWRQLPVVDRAELQVYNWSRLLAFGCCRFWHATFQFAIQDSSEKYSLLALFNRWTYHQKCQDHRDLIYGLLSLVDWDTVSGKALLPDYGKPLLQVVTETFILLMKHDQTKWTRHNIYSSKIQRLEMALSQGFAGAVFDIATTSRLSLSEPLPDRQTQFQYTLRGILIPNCGSLRLICINNKWTFDTPGQQVPGDHVHPTTSVNNGDAAEATPRQPYYSILNHEGEVGIYFSQHTRPGDWLLIGEHSFHPGAVIARRSEADGTFHLVSQVAFKDHSEYRRVAQLASSQSYCVDMRFDVEDYVVYSMTRGVLFNSSKPRRVGRHLPVPILDLLDSHVCRFKGSSFARRKER